jgi:hypothetical protein
MKLKTKLKIVGAIVLIAIFSNLFKTIYNGSKNLYNTSVSFNGEYTQAEQEYVTLFDAKYLAFQAKTDLAHINKETFITVTQIIMSNRKDGENLSWKWVSENQVIPYSEFTIFYKELSAFVTEQYDSLFAIEQRKQSIVARHNVMIKTYPNNVYNWFIKIKPIEYTFGYISDSTRIKLKK